jgi:DNA invertase Pin-like site-specific DNA recombinase
MNGTRTARSQARRPAETVRNWKKRAMIQERVRAGLKRAKDEGKTLGRPTIPESLEERIREASRQPC